MNHEQVEAVLAKVQRWGRLESGKLAKAPDGYWIEYGDTFAALEALPSGEEPIAVRVAKAIMDKPGTPDYDEMKARAEKAEAELARAKEVSDDS